MSLRIHKRTHRQNKIIQDSAPREILVKVYRTTYPKTGVTPDQL